MNAAPSKLLYKGCMSEAFAEERLCQAQILKETRNYEAREKDVCGP